MAMTLRASGSQLAVINTEYNLWNSYVDPGVFESKVDITNMLSGDTLELRVYGKTRASDTEALVYYQSLSGAPSATQGSIWVSRAYGSSVGCRLTLKQTAGTGRTFTWSVESY